MKIACFSSKPTKVKDADKHVGIYCDSKTVDVVHNNPKGSCVFEKDGFVFFTAEHHRVFSLTAKQYSPDKICCYVVGNRFVPNENFLGKKYKDTCIVFSHEHPSCIIEVIDGKFVVSEVKEEKPKKQEKKNE